MKKISPQSALGFVSVCFYMACLFSDVVYHDFNEGRFGEGVMALLLGWMSGIPAWFANPLYFIALPLVFWHLYAPAILVSLAALVFALSFLGHTQIMATEAGHMGNIVAYGWGYYLWCISITTLLVASIVGFFYSKRTLL